MTQQKIQLEINGLTVGVLPGSTVLQACDEVGVEIPRFCYHERLLVAGNCRMCLVEIAGSPKPQASCALPVTPGMKVFTDTPRVKKARERVREFLLLNHPLDCPICDQGGECDRQDESMAFGLDRGRGMGFNGSGIEPKRGVEDRDWNPRVKAIMTRCIHCTRCVRFASEVAGVSDRGTSGRGVATEVGSYVSKPRRTELSGNLVDLCPVGALTSKAYGFKARPWELKSVDRVDPRDGMGTMVRVQSRDQRILRILPTENDQINGAWLDDKSRYGVDGIQTNRLSSSMINGGQEKRNHDAALNLYQERLQSARVDKKPVHARVHSGLPLEVQQGLVDLSLSFRKQGGVMERSTLDSRYGDGEGHPSFSSFGVDSEDRSHSLDKIGESDRVRRLGVNLRTELPLVNARIRESYLRDRVEVRNWGPSVDLTYPVTHLGSSLDSLLERRQGTHVVSSRRRQARRPRVRLGSCTGSEEMITMAESMARSARRRSNRREREGNVMPGWKVLNPVMTTACAAGSHVLGRKRCTSSCLAKASHVRRFGVEREDLRQHGLSLPSGLASLVYFGSAMDPRVKSASLSIPRPSWYDHQGHRMNWSGSVNEAVPSLGQDGDRNEYTGKDGLRHALPVWRKASVVDKAQEKRVKRQRKGRCDRTPVCSSSLSPRVFDYYTESHSVRRRSARMAVCSMKMGSAKNFR